MRHALFTLGLLLTACGGHDEPGSAPSAAEHTAPPAAHASTDPPTGVRALAPGEPATPDLTGTGGGPGANSVAGVARAARALLERCWVDAARAGDARSPVDGVVSLHALPDGTVTVARANLSGDDVPDGLAECLERTGREVRLPVTTSEHDVDVPVGFMPPS